jgi:hypothetical protein
MTIQEWVTCGKEYVSALIPLGEAQEGESYSAHDGIHWYLELGVSSLEEECITAWTYGLCGVEYPLHTEYHQMGVEDRSLLPIELVNWLVGTL